MNFECFARMTWYETSTRNDKRFDKLYLTINKFVEDLGLCTPSMQKCYWYYQIIMIIKYKLFGVNMTVTGIFFVG